MRSYLFFLKRPLLIAVGASVFIRYVLAACEAAYCANRIFKPVETAGRLPAFLATCIARERCCGERRKPISGVSPVAGLPIFFFSAIVPPFVYIQFVSRIATTLALTFVIRKLTYLYLHNSLPIQKCVYNKITSSLGQ